MWTLSLKESKMLLDIEYGTGPGGSACGRPKSRFSTKLLVTAKLLKKLKIKMVVNRNLITEEADEPGVLEALQVASRVLLRHPCILTTTYEFVKNQINLETICDKLCFC